MAGRTRPVAELFGAACDGDRAALARLLSLIERGGDEAREIARLAHPLSGHGYLVGLTGAPGSGKSTLTERNDRSSAFTGPRSRRAGHRSVVAVHRRRHPRRSCAHAGPRHRSWRVHPLDGHSGHLGGLSLATPEAARLLDAIGRPWTLIETVGVGQVEVEIAGKADTTVVVVNPGWGDSVQANKAGLMEIADIFVINKADRKGVEETRRDLEQMLELSDLAARCVASADPAGRGDQQRGRRRVLGRRSSPTALQSKRRVSWLAAASFVSVRNSARSSPVVSSSEPASWRPATAGTGCRPMSPTSASTRGLPPTRCSPASTADPSPTRL